MFAYNNKFGHFTIKASVCLHLNPCQVNKISVKAVAIATVVIVGGANFCSTWILRSCKGTDQRKHRLELKMTGACFWLVVCSSLACGVLSGPRPAEVRWVCVCVCWGGGAGGEWWCSVIQKPWQARQHRRCRYSTWLGGTPQRGWTPQTSYGELWPPGCTSWFPCSTNAQRSRDLRRELMQKGGQVCLYVWQHWACPALEDLLPDMR